MLKTVPVCTTGHVELLNLSLSQFLDRNGLNAPYLISAATHFGPLVEEFGEVLERQNSTQIIGINGCQGSGKSTLADYLCTRIASEFNVTAVPLSLDDFYLTKAQRQKISQDTHPLLATRGVPGTHDIQLAIDTINRLKTREKTLITRFDKSTDDRMPDADSSLVHGPVGLIVIEGWCFGATPVHQRELLIPSNDLESQHDTDGVWRQYVNNALAGDYQTLFNMADRLVMLAAPSFDRVFKWRLEQEKKLIETLTLNDNGRLASKTMNEEEIKHFIEYFQRITEHCLLNIPGKADHLYRLNNDRSVCKAKAVHQSKASIDSRAARLAD